MKNIYHILVEQGNHVPLNSNLTVKGMLTDTGSHSLIFKGKILVKEEGGLDYFALISPASISKSQYRNTLPQFLQRQTLGILYNPNQSKAFIHTSLQSASYFKFLNIINYFALLLTYRNPILCLSGKMGQDDGFLFVCFLTTQTSAARHTKWSQ